MAKNISKIKTENKNIEKVQVQFEVKEIQDEDDEYFRFEGMASTFKNIDLVDDIMVNGAFRESLVKRLPIILWQHYSDEPIGMPEHIEETAEGLYIKVRLPKDDTLVKGRVIPQIKVGSIRTMSIGFRVIEREIDRDGNRRILKVDLLEVSLVTFPANPLAKIEGFKSNPLFKAVGFDGETREDAIKFIEDSDYSEEHKKTLMDILDLKSDFVINKESLSFLDNIEEVSARTVEKALRDSGLFTKSASVKLVSVLNRSDSEDNDDAALGALKDLNKKASESDVQICIKSMLSKFGD